MNEQTCGACRRPAPLQENLTDQGDQDPRSKAICTHHTLQHDELLPKIKNIGTKLLCILYTKLTHARLVCMRQIVL